MCREFCGELRRLEPASRPVIDVLDRRGILHPITAESGQSLAELLLKCLAEPRTREMDRRHVYWGLLERIHRPASNTQIVNVEFTGGQLDTTTCVSATHVLPLISETPGEYARIVEGLTSPVMGFWIVRPLRREVIKQRMLWLEGTFNALLISENELGIWVKPDAGAPSRALLEQDGRLFREYDFGARARRNSRLLVDVMVQSALTNYAMRGRYDSASDNDRMTRARGVPRPGWGSGAGSTDEYRSLIREVVHGQAPRPPARGSPVLGEMTEEQALHALEDRWTGGHHLERPFTIDIDA